MVMVYVFNLFKWYWLSRVVEMSLWLLLFNMECTQLKLLLDCVFELHHSFLLGNQIYLLKYFLCEK